MDGDGLKETFGGPRQTLSPWVERHDSERRTLSAEVLQLRLEVRFRRTQSSWNAQQWMAAATSFLVEQRDTVHA